MENEDLDMEEMLNTCNELRRSISRLSYVGMGISNDLDKELNNLRDVIKQEGKQSEIKISIDQISTILRTLDEDGKENSAALEQLDVLSLLLKKQLPSGLRTQLKSVKKKSKNEDAASIVRSIADVIDGYIKQVENKHLSENINTDSSLDLVSNSESGSGLNKIKTPGFFARLFTFGSSAIETATEQDSAAQILAEENTLNQNDVEVNLPEDIKTSLQHLINQLASMDGYADVADLLKQEIEKISKLTQLSSILEKITNAFIKISDQEHIQFEKFLKTLNTRIVRVNNFINQTLKFSESSQTNSKQLNLDFSANMGKMKISLSDSTSLEQAKTSVFSHMDTITTQLNQFCEKQESESNVLISQMDKLSEQLKATEDEAARLKDDLAEQRVRAQTDPLTKLPNRYSYGERLTQEYNRWRRYRNPLSLVMGDIDHFKRVNDTYGHGFGDQVLKEIGNFLSTRIRESDFIARFGGEEFVLLLPETGIVDATRAVNKIRSGIAKLEVLHDGKLVPITMSFGISEFDQDDTTQSVFERADKALYRAKEKGRNLVCCLRSKQA
ncbi:MAG: diguanylate cyclase [Kangiellaceae bacterium]|nr:diguanylate cyclase [Kangiellaceae bacterium]